MGFHEIYSTFIIINQYELFLFSFQIIILTFSHLHLYFKLNENHISLYYNVTHLRAHT